MDAAPSQFVERVKVCTDRLQSIGVEALGALFDLTSQRLVRYAVSLTRNQHDAEDAVQAALVQLAGKPSLLRSVRCPWAYLLQIVRNESLLIARKRRRAVNAADLTDMVTLCRVDELEREDTHRAVWSALRTLPAEQAEVVVLKIWEELTFAEIAEILDQSPNTIASRYGYAMTKLSQRLSKYQNEAYHD
jgi:RNA polymerase sigma-70 factor (ECF subfamily)